MTVSKIDMASAVLGTSRGITVKKDNHVFLELDLGADALGPFGVHLAVAGTLVGIAIIDAKKLHANPAAPLAPSYGQYATQLKLSGFFRVQKVWNCVGTDGHYLAWIRLQKSAISKEFSEYIDSTGEGRCVAAHVRRVANGSGTAIKPPFSAIPLTQAEHDIQSRSGETALKPQAWWDAQRIKYLEAWCWTTLREKLGYGSWREVPPYKLFDWAKAHEVEKYLPKSYKH